MATITTEVTETTSRSKTERRELKASANLIYHIIFRQAGTLSKAILEGVMNSEDAKATFVEITLDQNKFTIIDNGRGFASTKEIEDFFETFGTAHALDEDGISTDAKHGTFRIGRGQIFAFAKTVWKSGTFEMDVDVKGRGLEYDLTINSGHTYDGCRIDGVLYDSVSAPDLRETLEALKEAVKWMSIPVYINGDLCSRHPETEEWDLETKDFWIDGGGVSRSGVDVYQQGVFVMTVPHWRHGVSGTVVTKRPLLLNTARNDILSRCKVWNKAKAHLSRLGDSHIANLKDMRKDLSYEDIEAVFVKVHSGRKSSDPKNYGSLPLFTDISGNKWSARQIVKAAYKNSPWKKLVDGKLGIIISDSNQHSGDVIMQRNLALVFPRDTLLTACTSDGDSFLELIKHLSGSKSFYYSARICTAGELDNPEADHRVVKTTPREDRILRQLSSTVESIGRCIADHRGEVYSYQDGGRKLVIGKSSSASAWTDGGTYIAINRDEIPPGEVTESLFQHLGNLILHEMCHEVDTTTGHMHPPEFYRLFHDILFKVGTTLGRQALARYRVELLRKTKKVSKKASEEIKKAADQAYHETLFRLTEEAEATEEE